jgi:hypothetical protein
MRKKYIVIPGYITSKNDNDVHYISSAKLMALYNVNPKECFLYTEEDYERRKHMEQLKALKVLRPQYSGDYSL